jgi:hypothetical protein
MILHVGEACPITHGVAYYRFDTDQRVAYMVPLHWVVRYTRLVWTWIRFAGRRGAIDAAYLRGYRDGTSRD